MSSARSAVSLLAAVACVLTGVVTTTPSADAGPAYSVATLHFKVEVGPDDHICDIVGDVYVPRSATPTRRVPAVLTTHGFGETKDAQAGVARLMAENGYVVLAYSGLGFGGSDCKISLDDPAYDGKAASQLISYLGGAPGLAYRDDDHSNPAPALNVVHRDARDHLGRVSAHDPRVGMVGGSYGGGVQFAAAAVDPRLDTIVPMVTWSDLSYSLAPNNTDQVALGSTTGVGTRTPGMVKLFWGLGFTTFGALRGVEHAGTDPARLAPCPNFVDWVCPSLITGASTGFFQPDTIAKLRHASVATYVDKIKIPTLLMQGEYDTLFNLNEAIATYRALRHQGTPVKMVWVSWGHNGPPKPGELDLAAPNPDTQHNTRVVKNWLDHYLKDHEISTGPRFSYFRDWVDYTGDAAPAYASAPSYPVGTSRVYRLSGSERLVRGTTEPGHQSFLTVAAGAPSSVNAIDRVNVPDSPIDSPGTFAKWTTDPLARSIDVVGTPRVRLKVESPTATLNQGAGPAGKLVLFVKLMDVAPEGQARLIRALEAPVRVPDVSKRFTVTLPAIVHRFAPGHRIRLVVAGGSTNYRGGMFVNAVTIASGNNQTLTLPVVKPARPARPVSQTPGSTQIAPTGRFQSEMHGVR